MTSLPLLVTQLVTKISKLTQLQNIGMRVRAMLEISKVKKILSRKLFDELFDALNTSVNLLQRLVDQSLQREGLTKIGLGSRSRVVRSPIASIHKLLLADSSWSCSCRDKHSVLLPVDSKFESPNISDFDFRMVLVTLRRPTDEFYFWQEVEVEPTKSQAVNSTITDMCSMFAGKIAPSGGRISIGSLSEGQYEHKIFATQSSLGILASESLEKVLKLSNPAPCTGGFHFRKRDRLHLAVRLTCSVPDLHGSWLRDNWRTCDIRFPTGPNTITDFQETSLQQPFLSWSVRHEQVPGHTVSSAIPSPVLFPLALALIKLSLCCPIAAFQKPEDDNPEESISLLKTANRCLAAVYGQSGERYGTVVRRCLHWSETKDTDPDDETFRACYYKLVVSPLLGVKEAFDGS